MKLTKIFQVLFVASLLASPTTAIAQVEGNAVEAPKPRKKKRKKVQDEQLQQPLYYSSLGAGKTLPEGYARTRLFNRFIQGDRTIGSDGKPEDIGYKISAVSTAVALEYGLSEHLSFQLLVPYVTKNSIAFNSRTHKSSRTFAENKAFYENLFYNRLQSSGACANRAACEQFAKGNTALPAGSTLVLPTGESVDFSGVPVNQVVAAIPELIAKGAEPVDGETGLGDVDLGVTYAPFTNSKHIVSLGLGLRIPAGPFESVPQAKRPPGQGMMMGGLRFNYDWQMTPALWLSVQHQLEVMLVEGKRRKSSQLNPDQLNEADPTSDEAIAAGSNGEPNLQSVSRKGIGHSGFVRLDYGLSDLSSALQTVAIEGAFNYEKSAAPYLGNYKVNDGLQRYSFAYGIKFDGLGLRKPVPAYIRIVRDRFLEGKNVPIATSSITVEIAFYKAF